MIVIRRGVTRTVLLIGRWAVKVPSLRGVGYPAPVPVVARVASFCRGVLANISERQWHTFEGWAGRVAPVRFSLLGLVQVYPRCAPCPDDAELFELDPDPGDGADFGKRENFGLLAGQLVRVDYEMV